MIDRDKFFDHVRADPFGGTINQSQVDGISYLLDIWEAKFARDNPSDGTQWLAYCLATVFHETDQQMRPIPEYGEGAGYEYGEPAGPYGQIYHGRGHVQLTWLSNYEKGEQCLKEKHGLNVPMVQYPHRMLEDETSALVLFEGMIDGWYTGVGLPDFFDASKGKKDPYNARKIVNGLDRADLIQGYFYSFEKALL